MMNNNEEQTKTAEPQGQEPPNFDPGTIDSRDYIKVIQSLSNDPDISPDLMSNFVNLIQSKPARQNAGAFQPLFLIEPEAEARIYKVDFELCKLSVQEIMHLGPHVIDYFQYVFHDWQMLLTQGIDWGVILVTLFERALWDARSDEPSRYSLRLLNDFFSVLRPKQGPSINVLKELACKYANRGNDDESTHITPEQINLDQLIKESDFGAVFIMSAAGDESLEAFTKWLGLNRFFTSNTVKNAGGPTTGAISSLGGQIMNAIGMIGNQSEGEKSKQNLKYQNLVPQRG